MFISIVSIKLFLCPEPEGVKDPKFMISRKVMSSLKEESQVLMMFSALKIEREYESTSQPVVCEFPDDISDLPPEREVEFAIDLVLVATCRM